MRSCLSWGEPRQKIPNCLEWSSGFTVHTYPNLYPVPCQMQIRHAVCQWQQNFLLVRPWKYLYRSRTTVTGFCTRGTAKRMTTQVTRVGSREWRRPATAPAGDYTGVGWLTHRHHEYSWCLWLLLMQPVSWRCCWSLSSPLSLRWPPRRWTAVVERISVCTQAATYFAYFLLQQAVGGRPPRYAPPVSSLCARRSAAERLTPPSTPQRSSSIPRRIRSHADRCSCLTH